MNELKPVIEAVSSLRDLLERASNANTRRNEFLAKIPNQLEVLQKLLAQQPVREAVDTALVAAIEATQRFPTEPAAMTYLESKSKEFIDFEMRLYAQHRLKRTEIEDI